ncbi:hypothetical protein [Thermococcus thioreducens]|uniref:Uncharacterized protein n=3 Tax=Thermococcus thioreducens TaxID=277988 RepID=A0A1I0N389_9EURY|nr:hypothetical protein [Thermococcus thioreducens]SEV95285.1 hypothetical protein SAMN05216170_1072 [Thermococcus thioreducens]
MVDPPIPVVKNPKLHEPSDYERMKGGFYEAGKWSTFLHLLVTPIIAKYGFGKISDLDYRKNFVKALKEALSRVKIADVKAYLHNASLKPERVNDLKDGFLLPPLEEVLQGPKKRDEFVSWLRVALRDVGVRTYEEEIDKMIDRVYPLAMKIHDKFVSRWGGFDEWGHPITTVASEEVKKWEEFEEYLKILQEFAGVKLKQPEPTIAEKKAQPVERIQTEERTIGTSTDLTSAKLEVLSMLQALKLLNYSEEAVNNAMMDFKRKIMDIIELENPTLEDLCRLGMYYLALSYIKEGKFEKAEEALRHL